MDKPLRSYTSVGARRKALSKHVGAPLNAIGSSNLDTNTASSKHCENMIGMAQVPMGVAGPLQIQSLKTDPKKYFVPLATTEGALVASVNRGAKAITDSGGTYAYAYKTGVTRAPVFRVGSWKNNEIFYSWLQENKDAIKKITESTSSHLKLLDIEVICTSPYIFVRFAYDTGDAMGMNMVTIATEKAVEFIEHNTKIRCISLSGNVDVDKKPAWRNVISRRGWLAGAEVEIPNKILKNVLKTDAVSFYEVWISKCMVGSAISGSMGFNAHIANMLAALFISTGQDVAHVAECSSGMVICEVREKNLFISVQIPNLMVGTVGGGTGLPTQKQALSIIGITKQEQTEEFARVVAGTVLAGEVSLLASLSEGTLAKAHKKLAR